MTSWTPNDESVSKADKGLIRQGLNTRQFLATMAKTEAVEYNGSKRGISKSCTSKITNAYIV